MTAHETSLNPFFIFNEDIQDDPDDQSGVFTVGIQPKERSSSGLIGLRDTDTRRATNLAPVPEA